MDNISTRRYVRLNIETDELFQDVSLFPEEVSHLNEKLAADGSEFRWVPYGQREGDAVAA
jgi:hypothetical protein